MPDYTKLAQLQAPSDEGRGGKTYVSVDVSSSQVVFPRRAVGFFAVNENPGFNEFLTALSDISGSVITARQHMIVFIPPTYQYLQRVFDLRPLLFDLGQDSGSHDPPVSDWRLRALDALSRDDDFLVTFSNSTLTSYDANGRVPGQPEDIVYARLDVEAAGDLVTIPADVAGLDSLLSEFRWAVQYKEPGGKNWQDLLPRRPKRTETEIWVRDEGVFTSFDAVVIEAGETVSESAATKGVRLRTLYREELEDLDSLIVFPYIKGADEDDQQVWRINSTSLDGAEIVLDLQARVIA